LAPGEAVELQTMLHAYTKDAAFGVFLEDEIGSIEKGKLADVIILDRNLFELQSHQIHGARVEMSIFNGQIVHDNQ